MKRLIIALLCLFVSPAFAGTTIIKKKASTESYSDITFFWTAESTTLGANDYSAGDTTATVNDTVAINTAAARIGTNGLDVPSSWDAVSFDVVNDDIINSQQFRIGVNYRCTARTNNARLVELRNSSGHYITLNVGSTDEIELKRYITLDDMITTTDANLVCDGSTWYFIEAYYDDINNIRKIFIDGVEKASSTAAFTGITDVNALRIGSWLTNAVDEHLDNIMISNSPSTRNFYTDTFNGTTLKFSTESPR